MNIWKKPKNFVGKVAFITGAASGIGKGLAQQLAFTGCKVIIADINYSKAQELANEINKKSGPQGPCEAFAVYIDVSSAESIKQACLESRKHFGSVHILVNNAGIVIGKHLKDLSSSEIDKIFKINIISHFLIIKEFLPDMIKSNQGHIVTIASFAGFVGTDKLVDYTSTKFACVGLDEALRNEFKVQGYNIKTTCICPYYINTGMFNGVKTPIKLLEESYVVDEIFNAIKFEKKLVLLPKYLGFVLKIAKALPLPWYDFIVHNLKFNRSMDTFTGRPKL